MVDFVSFITNLNWFLFFLLTAIFFLPVGIYGYYSIYVKLRNFMRVRSGWLIVWKKLSNLRWISFWAKPTGRKIKTKTSEGIEIEIPIEIEKGKLGTMKRIEIDPSKIETLEEKADFIKDIKNQAMTQKEADERNININLGDLTPQKIEWLQELVK